jgi:FkbM family methyltransferase
MGRNLRSIAIAASDRLLRDYIRYSPIQAFKSRAWSFYEEHFCWRTQSRIADTPFGFKLRIELPDHIQKVIWLTGRWEPVITEFFRQTLTPGDTFVDVGANIGYYSLLASRIVGDTGHVYSIEASPTIFHLLERNIALNHVANVVPVQEVAADSEGEREFWLSWEHNRGQSTAVEAVGRRRGMNSEGRVRCGTLTSIVPNERLLSARLIKIDVEGAERSVLEPLFALLPQFSDRTVWAIELSPEFCPGGQDDVERIFDAFGAAGYQAAALKNDYALDNYLSKPRSVDLKRITSAPSSQADVVFFKDQSALRARRTFANDA